ncbi:MAG TPA: hypothetical protein VLJ68_06340 [Chitinophagaceae bacterium]|nr:hypothetical protein [Chitinophagaceae bacterium]
MRTGMKPVRSIVLGFFISIFTVPTFSQSISTANGKIELGLGLGPSFFLGDLGGTRGIGMTFIKDLNLPLTKFCKGVYLNFYPAEWIGFRFSANVGQLEAYDSIIKTDGHDETYRKQRNLGFRSNFVEGYVAAEIYPTVILEGDADALQYKFRPYGLMGFGYFHYNPKAQYTDPYGNKKWVELKPLRLEGQGMAEYPTRHEYNLTQPEWVMGGGFKYYIKENMYIGMEILHRKVFTDYVDDVSTKYIDPYYFDVYLTPEQAAQAKQLAYREKYFDPTINRPYIGGQRGDPRENDAYFSAILRVGWRLEGKDYQRQRSKKQLKCPVFF